MSTEKVRSQPGTVLVRSLLWLSLGALALELVLRSALVSPSTNQFDPIYGSRPIPGASLIQSQEGYTRARFNSFGHLDTEPGALGNIDHRVLLLGDSYSQAKQVFPEESFDRIAERLTGDLEIVNTAQGGWYPPHYLHWLRNRVGDFSPDLLLIQLNDGDLLQYSRNERVRLIRSGPDRRWNLVLRPPVPPSGFLSSLHSSLMHASSLYTIAYRRAKLLLQQERNRLTRKFQDVVGPEAALPADELQEWLEAFHRQVVQLGVPVVYLYIPQLEYEYGHAEPTFPESREVYRRFARNSSVALLDATTALIDCYLAEGQPLHGFHNSEMGEGHLNTRGHQVVARLVTSALSGRLP